MSWPQRLFLHCNAANSHTLELVPFGGSPKHEMYIGVRAAGRAPAMSVVLDTDQVIALRDFLIEFTAGPLGKLLIVAETKTKEKA